MAFLNFGRSAFIYGLIITSIYKFVNKSVVKKETKFYPMRYCVKFYISLSF